MPDIDVQVDIEQSSPQIVTEVPETQSCIPTGPLSTIGYHPDLDGRSLMDQHPIWAITGLMQALADKMGRNQAYTKEEVDELIRQIIVQHTFIYKQETPSAEWVIDHPLNKRASVMLTDLNGVTIGATIEYVNDSRIKILGHTAFSGYAYLN